jgi:hypothetical protein
MGAGSVAAALSCKFIPVARECGWPGVHIEVYIENKEISTVMLIMSCGSRDAARVRFIGTLGVASKLIQQKRLQVKPV